MRNISTILVLFMVVYAMPANAEGSLSGRQSHPLPPLAPSKIGKPELPPGPAASAKHRPEASAPGNADEVMKRPAGQSKEGSRNAAQPVQPRSDTSAKVGPDQATLTPGPATSRHKPVVRQSREPAVAWKNPRVAPGAPFTRTTRERLDPDSDETGTSALAQPISRPGNGRQHRNINDQNQEAQVIDIRQAASALALTAILAGPAPALAQADTRPDKLTTNWDYLRSVMRATVTKQGRIDIVFAWPDGRLNGLYGIAQNAVLFSGEQVGPFQIAGQAKWYSRHCPPANYTVRGHLSADGNMLTLYGTPPGFVDKYSCRLIFPKKIKTIVLHRIDRKEALAPQQAPRM
jgi:hypothetical protein